MFFILFFLKKKRKYREIFINCNVRLVCICYWDTATKSFFLGIKFTERKNESEGNRPFFAHFRLVWGREVNEGRTERRKGEYTQQALTEEALNYFLCEKLDLPKICHENVCLFQWGLRTPVLLELLNSACDVIQQVWKLFLENQRAQLSGLKTPFWLTKLNCEVKWRNEDLSSIKYYKCYIQYVWYDIVDTQTHILGLNDCKLKVFFSFEL